MRRFGMVIAALAVVAVGAAPAGAQQQETLNLVTAGDQNMVDRFLELLEELLEAGQIGGVEGRRAPRVELDPDLP